MPCPPQLQNAVNAKLNEFGKACTEKDVARLLKLYDSSVANLIEDTRNIYTDYFSLDDVELRVDFGDPICEADTIRVPMWQRMSYTLDSVSQYSSEWSWLDFTGSESNLRIVSEEKARYLKCDFTDLQLELAPDSALMRGRCKLTLTVLQSGPTSVLLKLNRGLKVSKLEMNGKRYDDFSRHGITIELTPPSPLVVGDTLNVSLEYSGSLFNESKIYGYSQVNIGPEGSFASWVTDWYPRNLSGSSKSRGHIVMTIPDSLKLACSGHQTALNHNEGKATYEYSVDNPIDYTFAAADYLHASRDVNGTEVGVYFLEGDSNKVKLYMDQCAKILAFEAGLYGGYPFASYYLVEIPSSVTGNLGGSSEQGMNLYPTGTLPERKVNLPLLSHELAHSWWGNLVGSASGAIISEGLAQFTAVLSYEHFKGEEAMRKFLEYGQPDYTQSASQYFQRYTGPEPVVTDLPIGEVRIAQASVLHELADVKGHFVYEMLSRKIGQQAMLAGLRSVIKEFRGRQVSLDDLKTAFEKESGQNLDTFFAQWFHRTGAPKFDLSYKLTPRGEATQVQGSVVQDSTPYTVDAELGIRTQDSSETRTIEVSGPKTNFSFEVAGLVDTVIFDPDYKIFRYTPQFEHLYLLSHGTKLRVDKKFDDAATELTEFVRYFPRNLEGHYQLARAYQGANEDSLSIDSFRKVVELYADGVPYAWPVAYAHLNLGKMYAAQGDTSKARLQLKQTLEFSQEKPACQAAQTMLDSLSKSN